MHFINLKTLQYPVNIYKIREETPNVSYPDSPTFVPEGYAFVEPTAFPAYDRNTQEVKENPPVQENGVWKQSWSVVELSAEQKSKIREAKQGEVKKRRNALLQQSDWTQLPDVNLSNKDAWNKYRQDLRDITTQVGYPFNVTWPEQP